MLRARVRLGTALLQARVLPGTAMPWAKVPLVTVIPWARVPLGTSPALAMLLAAGTQVLISQPACEAPAPGRFPKPSQMTGLFTKAGRKERP